MNMQLVSVVIIITLACAYLARGMYRTWFGVVGKTACGTGCHSCPKGEVKNTPEFTRRIALPQV